MTNNEFKEIVQEEIAYCENKLVDCDENEYDFYNGAMQALNFVLIRLKNRQEAELCQNSTGQQNG